MTKKMKLKALSSKDRYTEFMEAVRAVEDAGTDEAFDEALEAVENVFAHIEGNEDEFSSAELRRASRAMKHIESLQEES